MRKYWKILLPLVILGLGAWLLVRSWETEVLVGTATRGPAVDAVTGTIEILAFSDIWVKSEREGKLAEVPVKIGDFVEKGQLVAVQESKLLDFQLEQTEVRLEAARARLELPLPTEFDVQTVEKDVEALRLQVELGQIPRAHLEQRERDLRKLRAVLAAERIQREEAAGILASQVKELEYQKEQMRLRSFVAGEVTEIYGIIGDRINPNQNVVRVISNHRVVHMELSEEDFGGIEIGDPVTIHLASYPNREFHGTVKTFFATANSQEKTRLLTVEVDASKEVLVPGLTGEGLLVKERHENAILVPRRALVGNRLYVVEDGKIEVREVKFGFLSLNRAEILEGIEVGEKVVLEGQDMLRDGQSVTIVPPIN